MAADDSTWHTPPRCVAHCPSCGGLRSFQPSDALLACPYCATKEIPPTAVPRASGWSSEEDLRAGLPHSSAPNAPSPSRCSGCGGVLDLPDYIETSICPFCTGPMHQVQTAPDAIPPAAVLPFEIDRNAAEARIRRTLNREYRLSGDAALRHAPDLVIHGVYIPFWEFKAGMQVNYGMRQPTAEARAYRLEHQGVFYPAADGLEAACRSALQGWDLEHAIAYHPSWVTGFVVERPSLAVGPILDKAQKDFVGLARRAASHAEDSPIIDLTRWSTKPLEIVRFEARVENLKGRLVLAPIWLGRISDGDASYVVAVNGQTGEVGGQRPSLAWKGTYGLIFGLGALILLFLAGFRWE